jgi:hypothetical protein
MNRIPPLRWLLTLVAGFGFSWSTPVSAQGTYWKAGWQAKLSTVSHGVRGTVTIVDENTYRVDDFHYDGLGISVFFYLGATDQRSDFLAGRRTGSNLLGPAFAGASLTVDLPAGATFDQYGAISVWCTAAGSSFGSGAFAPYARAGWQAALSTVSHGVRGTVTLVDADTFRVDDFFYDGGGIDVFFYLGAADTRASFTAGKPVGPQLLRATPFAGETLTVDLPAGMTFDGLNAISVWCTAVSSSFGSGAFISPRAHWRRTHFGSTAAPQGADGADPDADGQPNLLEYATRTPPGRGNGSALPPPVRVTLPGGAPGLRISFPFRAESRDIRYRIMAGGDLAGWQEIYRYDPLSGPSATAPVQAGLPDLALQELTLTVPVPNSTQFWRLEVDPVN